MAAESGLNFDVVLIQRHVRRDEPRVERREPFDVVGDERA
jgi:hypothetical protein